MAARRGAASPGEAQPRRQHQRLGIEDLARQCSVSYDTLYRAFRRVLGRSPLEQIYRQRVEIARQRLLNTHDKVATIAHECGFLHPDDMARYFKRWLGVTPSELRLRQGGEA